MEISYSYCNFPDRNFFCNITYAITQIMTDSKDPVAVASPIGYNVAGKSFDIKKAPGTRTSEIAMMLCKNDSPDLPQAQKYPLKLKCIPANMQSQIYPRKY